MRDADDNLQGLTAHNPANIYDVSDGRVTAVELDQNVGGVGCEDAKRDDWSAVSRYSPRIYTSRPTSNDSWDQADGMQHRR
jgi:hypothetical protein